MSNHRFKIGTLLDMLTYCRPAGSRTEADFIDLFLVPLGGSFDAHRNYHVTIGESPILWSCHTDTVHRTPGRQTLHYDAIADMVHLSKRSKHLSTCLGADDTAGVFLCQQMILAGIAGHYVFHFAEETGGHGSSDLARFDPSLISDATYAIALDRKGHTDVITHQAWSRCCSNAFADSLASELCRVAPLLDFGASDHGVFTDTANYTTLIGECTNLSVGYEHAHTPDETLDVSFLDELFGALCTIDPGNLIAERTPDDMDDDDDEWTWIGNRTNDWSYPQSSTVAPLTLVSRITKPDILFAETCQWCGQVYNPEESDASDNLTYCTDECETDSHDCLGRFEDARQSSDSIYLDPMYEDVQIALRKCQVRR